jgi:hypothetical protein
MFFFTWDANAARLAVSVVTLVRRAPVRPVLLGAVCSAVALAAVLFQIGFVGARSPLHLLHTGGGRTAYYLTPLVAVAYWLLKGAPVRRRFAVIWLAVPLAYAVPVTLWFARATALPPPYPFLDAGMIGWPAVLRNCLIAGGVALTVNVALTVKAAR